MYNNCLIQSANPLSVCATIFLFTAETGIRTAKKLVMMAIENITYTRFIGKSTTTGSSMNRKNCAVTVVATTNPTNDPRRSELMMTAYYSYIKTRMPSLFVSPMALKQPYSHTFSLTFYVVEIKRRKNAIMSAMTPTIALNIENNWSEAPTDSSASCLSRSIVLSSLKYERTPSAIYSLLL